MKGFPVEFSREGRFVRAQAIDLPLAFAVGTSTEHALRQMRQSIDRGMQYRVKEGLPLPAPSAARGLPVVQPSLRWRCRIARQQWRCARAALRARLASLIVGLHRGSHWSMPAFNTLMPCALMLA